MTKSVGRFEENKFSVSGHQFLLEYCPKLIKTYNFGQNAVNKSQYKNKNEQYCTVGLFVFIVADTFCRFSICDCHYFLPCYCKFSLGEPFDSSLMKQRPHFTFST